MRDRELYGTLLGIEPPWEVTDVTMDVAEEAITVRVELRPGAHLPCPACGREDCSILDRRERTWRHLDTCRFKTFIAAPLPRTQCPACGVKTVAPPWAQEYSRFTMLFERFAIDALQEMSKVGACKLLGITWDEAAGIVDRAVARGLAQRDLSGLRRIGIDEKQVFHGHRYITVVSDLETSTVVWMGEDRTEATLDGFFASLPKEVLNQIECITMDMWEPYYASCRKWIPDFEAKIVLDRFPIDRHLNGAVDTVRKEEHRALSEEGIDLLAKTKWDWLYHPENLPEKREARFEETRQYDLKTVRAHALKENFRWFWTYAYVANARKFFRGWYFWATHSRLAPVIKVAKMLHRHLARILTYFRFGVTNATAEGLNNKIQKIKEKAYGFRNLRNFMNAIYFHCGGLNLYPL
jgi:transposase